MKFTVRFKGRELQHSHLGKELMDKIKEDMKDIGKVELHPKFDGKQMIVELLLGLVFLQQRLLVENLLQLFMELIILVVKSKNFIILLWLDLT